MCLSPLSVSTAQQAWIISINFHDHNIHIIIILKNCKKNWKYEAVCLASYSKSQAGNHWFCQFNRRSFKADILFTFPTFKALKMAYYFFQTFKDPRKPALCWTQEASLRLVLNCIPLTGSITHHYLLAHQAPHLPAAWPCPNRHPTYQQHDPTLHLLSHQEPHLLASWPCSIRHPTYCQHDLPLHFLPHQAPHLQAAWPCPIRHPTYWQHDPVPSGTPLTGSMTLSHQAPHLPATWPCPIRHPTYRQHDPPLHLLSHQGQQTGTDWGHGDGHLMAVHWHNKQQQHYSSFFAPHCFSGTGANLLWHGDRNLPAFH